MNKLIWIPHSLRSDESDIPTWDWEKVRNFSISLSSILAALLIPLVGHIFTRAIKNREIEGQFVSLAVSILKEKPNPPETTGLREWSVNVINAYSGVKIEGQTRKDIVDSMPLLSIDFDETVRRVKDMIAFDLGLGFESISLSDSLREDLGYSATGLRDLKTLIDKTFFADVGSNIDGNDLAQATTVLDLAGRITRAIQARNLD